MMLANSQTTNTSPTTDGFTLAARTLSTDLTCETITQLLQPEMPWRPQLTTPTDWADNLSPRLITIMMPGEPTTVLRGGRVDGGGNDVRNRSWTVDGTDRTLVTPLNGSQSQEETPSAFLRWKFVCTLGSHWGKTVFQDSGLRIG